MVSASHFYFILFQIYVCFWNKNNLHANVYVLSHQCFFIFILFGCACAMFVESNTMNILLGEYVFCARTRRSFNNNFHAMRGFYYNCILENERCWIINLTILRQRKNNGLSVVTFHGLTLQNIYTYYIYSLLLMKLDRFIIIIKYHKIDG